MTVLNVIGGTYREICLYPTRDELFGSGLKAACALSSQTKVKFHSCLSQQEESEAIALCNTFNIDHSFTMRDVPIEFHYFTPLAPPKFYGLGQQINLDLKCKHALVFGMLEAELNVTADKMVYDPQKPKSTSIDRKRLVAKDFAIVLNKHESRELTGIEDPLKAIPILIKNYDANVVVIKCGALGLVVSDGTNTKWVNVVPTNNVWAIGSGDIFSAAFAYYWIAQDCDPFLAASGASLAVARWTVSPDLYQIQLPEVKESLVSTQPKIPKIYLAGPFFNLGQNWLIETSKFALENLGAEVFSPLHKVGRGGDEVAQADLDGLNQCSSVLALLDDIDSGTVFEIGYALAKNIKIIGYSQSKTSDNLKMIRGSGIPIFDDFSTAIYNSIWAGM